nr:hypothetical protein [Tanacetum cinerariifolium]
MRKVAKLSETPKSLILYHMEVNGDKASDKSLSGTTIESLSYPKAKLDKKTKNKRNPASSQPKSSTLVTQRRTKSTIAETQLAKDLVATTACNDDEAKSDKETSLADKVLADTLLNEIMVEANTGVSCDLVSNAPTPNIPLDTDLKLIHMLHIIDVHDLARKQLKSLKLVHTQRMNHHPMLEKSQYDSWQIRMLLYIRGLELSPQERESKLYNEFDRFTSEKEETIHSYMERVESGPDVQALTTTTIFQTDDIDAFDLDYDEAPTSSVVFRKISLLLIRMFYLRYHIMTLIKIIM